MRGRLAAALAFGIATCAAGSGCAVPPYHLPAGFSSTYQRQVYGMEPVPDDPHYLGMTAVDSRSGVFYPITAFHDQPTVAEKPQERQSLAPMFLGSDPLNPDTTGGRSTSGNL
jgi:hypothetical protein